MTGTEPSSPLVSADIRHDKPESFCALYHWCEEHRNWDRQVDQDQFRAAFVEHLERLKQPNVAIEFRDQIRNNVNSDATVDDAQRLSVTLAMQTGELPKGWTETRAGVDSVKIPKSPLRLQSAFVAWFGSCLAKLPKPGTEFYNAVSTAVKLWDDFRRAAAWLEQHGFGKLVPRIDPENDVRTTEWLRDRKGIAPCTRDAHVALNQLVESFQTSFPPKVPENPNFATPDDVKNVAWIANVVAEAIPKLILERTQATKAFDALKSQLDAQRDNAEATGNRWVISEYDRENDTSLRDQLSWIKSDLTAYRDLMNLVTSYAKYFFVVELATCPIIESNKWRNQDFADWVAFKKECFLVGRMLSRKASEVQDFPGAPPEHSAVEPRDGLVKSMASQLRSESGQNGTKSDSPHLGLTNSTETIEKLNRLECSLDELMLHIRKLMEIAYEFELDADGTTWDDELDAENVNWLALIEKVGFVETDEDSIESILVRVMSDLDKVRDQLPILKTDVVMFPCPARSHAEATFEYAMKHWRIVNRIFEGDPATDDSWRWIVQRLRKWVVACRKILKDVNDPYNFCLEIRAYYKRELTEARNFFAVHKVQPDVVPNLGNRESPKLNQPIADTAIKQENHSNSPVEIPSMSEKEYQVLEEMKRLNATSADTRQNCETIAKACDGPQADFDSFKGILAEFTRRRLTASKTGRGGGSWLLSEGIKIAETLLENRKATSKKQ